MGLVQSLPLPKNFRDIFDGSHDMLLPKLNGVVKVPIFDRTGKIRTDKGYIPELGVYLHPSGQFRAVPPTPSQAEVQEAVGWLLEAIRDFPFSDAFGGMEQEPIYLDQNGPDGHPLVNLARGASSRVNAIAMILGPQLRPLFDGPMPAFHIDKPAPGSGAGFLVDVVAYANTGRSPFVQTLSKNDEEIRKNLTATLKDGPAILFFDNVNHKVDAADLAAALTSGLWRDRMLGHSQTIEIEMKTEWIFAGNNISFSSEMLRRLVPVRLDADTARPAVDRPQSMFKNTFPQWLKDHWLDLLWASQVLIANWFAKGCPEATVKLEMQSFNEWARVVGGVLSAAGLEGVLTNRASYLDQYDKDQRSDDELVEFLAEKFGTREFTTREALEVLETPFGGYQVDLPVSTTKGPAQTAKNLKQWMERNLTGNIFVLKGPVLGPVGFEIRGKNGICKVKLAEVVKANKTTFQFHPR